MCIDNQLRAGKSTCFSGLKPVPGYCTAMTRNLKSSCVECLLRSNESCFCFYFIQICYSVPTECWTNQRIFVRHLQSIFIFFGTRWTLSTSLFSFFNRNQWIEPTLSFDMDLIGPFYRISYILRWYFLVICTYASVFCLSEEANWIAKWRNWSIQFLIRWCEIFQASIKYANCLRVISWCAR